MGKEANYSIAEHFWTLSDHWVRGAFPMSKADTVAFDGKTARRSRDRPNGKPCIHMVSAWAGQSSPRCREIRGGRKRSLERRKLPALGT